MNLCASYSYRIIRKLTVFLQLQEFSLCNQTVESSTSAARHYPHILKRKWVAPLSRLKLYVLTLTLTGRLSLQETHEPITLANVSSINLLFIFRCSSLPSNPVYVSRVNPSELVFNLSSHRQSYIGLPYNSRFIDL